MSTTTNQAVVSNTVTAGYNLQFNTIYDAMLKPQIFGELIDLYGKGLGIFDMIHFAGNTIDVKGHKQTVWSQGAIQKPITLLGTIATGSAGADITFKIATAEYDTNYKTFLSVNDAILIPEEWMGTTSNGPAKYQVVSKSGSTNDITYTAKPFLSAYQVTIAVPTTTKLMVTGGNYAPGSQGASAKSRGWYSQDYYTALKRRAFSIEGGQQSDERWQDKLKNGASGMFSKASIEADFLMTADLNDELFLGEEPTNATLTMDNREGDSNALYGTKGIWRHLDTDGGSQEYSDLYEIADFDDIKDMFRSQGVINQAALFAVGSGLNQMIENSGLDFLKEFSGGTDLMKNMDEVGIQFKKIKKNSILFSLVELATFDNPQTYGLSSYDWKNRGFIVPNEFGQAKLGDMGSETVTLSNLTLGHKNHNGEDRTRVSGILGGVNGMGYRFVDTYDDVRGELLTECMLIATKRNQMIKVTKA
jgi:hypothetical protein